MSSNSKKAVYKNIITAIIITAVAVSSASGVSSLVSADKSPAKEIVNNNSKTFQAESDLLFKDRTATVNLWAEALKQRNGSFRYAVLSNELKAKEYKTYNDMYWVIGVSSPWVVGYTTSQVAKIDNNTYKYKINYVMTDSTRAKYNASEIITVKKIGQEWFVIQYENYGYVPDAKVSKEQKYSKVQPSMANSTLISRDKLGTATLWAEALKQRNGSFRYAVLTRKLKTQEYRNYSSNNWVIGGSSPWVVSYTINEKSKINNETYKYEIDYTLTDSTKAIYNAREEITVNNSATNWYVIKHDNYVGLPNITKKK
jgi:bla regulator protein BlaR1